MLNQLRLAACNAWSGTQLCGQTVRAFNSNASAITKIHRATYARTYPVVVVLPNGATINVKYHEPRKIIQV